MIHQEGIVVAVEGRDVSVEFARQTACGHCEVNGSCGTGALGKVLGRRSNRIRLENSLDAQVGDRVIVGVKENVLLSAAAWAYVAPLAGLLVAMTVVKFLGAGGGWMGSEVATIIGAGLGLVLGLWMARKYNQSKSGNNTQHAVLVSKVPGAHNSAPIFWAPRASSTEN